MTDTEKSVECSDTGATAQVAGRFFFFFFVKVYVYMQPSG